MMMEKAIGARELSSFSRLDALLAYAASSWPEAVALEATREHWSYARLLERADGLARALALEPNEPVIVMVSNIPDDIAALFAVWRARGVAVPVHRGNPQGVIDRLIERTGARWVVDGAVRPLHTPAPTPRALLNDGALIIYTSGSTGEPKGAVLSHSAYCGKLAAIDSQLSFKAGERALLVLNLSFSFGIWVSLLTLARGGTLVIHERFAPQPFIDALDHGGFKRTALVPTMLRSLFSTDYSGSSLAGQLLTGGEVLGATLAARTQAAFPDARLIDIYGLTETATSDFMLFPEDYPRFAGSIGRASPGVRFRIAAPEGESGELQIDTPYRMAGYLDAPDLTAAAFDGPWFRTGDLGRCRDDGVVELVGRAKDIISRAGIKVSPLEIEHVFSSCSGVAAAMAVGVPDDVLGERIHLLVVPRTGVVLDLDSVRGEASHRLPKVKQPDRIYVAANLPLGRTGKADRGALRALIARGEFG